MAVLAARAVHKSYEGVQALRGVDLEAGAGRIVALVGNNGAGKSTLLKILCGLTAAGSGSATIDGHPTTSAPVRRRLGYVPEDSPLDDDVSPRAFLAFFARLHRLPASEAKARAEALLDSLRLDPSFRDRPIGQLSKGSARKVALACALQHAPDVLILDEPASGLDPATRRELDAFLLGQRKAGRSIVLSAHDLDQVESIADEIVLLHQGRVVERGTLPELRERWGGTRYRMRATMPFPGSHVEGSLHAALLSGLGEAEAAIAAVRQASGHVLEMESVAPPLAEILRRAAGG